MGKQAATAVAHGPPIECENCAATLHGAYCHACGQSVHNPIRHLDHAVEEFFEAFWHLDGRLFRTLRDLWSPGRAAINYLAGHAEVERARMEAGQTPGVDPALVVAEVRVQSAAANRILELEGKPPATGREAGGPPPAVRPARLQLNILGHTGEWHPQDNPFIVGWWPGFANDWLNRKLGNLEKNMQSLGSGSADSWLKAMMAAAPSALFLLVPVFALLVRVAYLFSGRVYLEHLVVALLMQKRVYRQAWWLTLLKYLVIGYVYFMMLLVATMLVFLARLTAA